MKSVFIESLARLRQDRAALAALRRGLGKAPGEQASLFPYVMPYVGRDAPRYREVAYMLVAPLFALHPDADGHEVSLPTALARVARETESPSIEGRFVALLNCHPDDLGEHLRHAVSLAKSKGITLDWDDLMSAVLGWGHEDRWVQRRWARDFWAHQESAASESSAEPQPVDDASLQGARNEKA